MSGLISEFLKEIKERKSRLNIEAIREAINEYLRKEVIWEVIFDGSS